MKIAKGKLQYLARRDWKVSDKVAYFAFFILHFASFID
jgi:hypothetical protein